MRRLPVYLLVDVSGSMHGEPIESVKRGDDRGSVGGGAGSHPGSNRGAKKVGKKG